MDMFKRICGKCTKTIIDDELIVKCSGVCSKVFHADCVKVDNATIESIKQCRLICFRCEECGNHEDIIIAMFRTMKNSMVKFELYQKKYHDEISSRLDKVENTLEISGKIVVAEIKKVDDEMKKVDEKFNDGKWKTVEKKKKKNNTNIRKSTVIVTPNAQSGDNVRDKLRKSIKDKIDSSDYDVLSVSNAPLNGVSIQCEDEEKCEKLIREIEEKLDGNVTISKPKNFNPRIKLIKLRDAEKDDNQFVEILKNKNPSLQGTELKIIRREVVRINGKCVENLSNVIIEVNPKVHNEIMKTRKIKHVWEIVRVVDSIYIRRCYKCMGFNHNAADCKNNIACGECSGNHSSKECDNNEKKCINCVKANERLNMETQSKYMLDVNHSAWSKECSMYKKKLEHSKKAINTID